MVLANIRTWADARAFLQTAAPVVMTLLVTNGVLTDSEASLWVGLVLAVASPALARWNTIDGFRKWLYPVIGAANAVIIGYGIADAATVGMWLPVVTLILGGTVSGVANANTPTSD
ncbi:hypothetical protein [Tomitella gaofuii]|uniref:phage holin n=1 Tax=Tomitella gaofuii TaxID=2760083 RepID=UPI0015FE4344|nr:hypothetical protein [Tomitella gaofuii]